MKNLPFIIINAIFLIYVHSAESGFSDYIKHVGSFLGYSENNGLDSKDEFTQKIPYEVSTADEKFISEAAKLTGVALSELDSCQHRVVLSLQQDCHKMNDEQLAKMAVHLLNCQSFVEGRKMYPCTEEMSIKSCTMDMDSDTWTSYHLMSNRARAVCYSIRQAQFRGLAENTVNNLMDAARNQLSTLGKISKTQTDLKNIAENTYDVLHKGHELLAEQQSDLRKAQLHGQLTLEDNIRRLVDEKRLISDSHSQLMQMTLDVQKKLEESALQVKDQAGESKLNHKELISDIMTLQRKTKEIFQKIDESSRTLLNQNEQFKLQYEATLRNLAEVNRTVHSLVNLVGGTRQALEERLAWVSTALGGTDLAVERLYLILWHFAYMLIAMLACAFLAASNTTRFFVATLPPLNLSVALYDEGKHLDPFSLSVALITVIFVQFIVTWVINFKNSTPKAIPWIKKKLTAHSTPIKTDIITTTQEEQCDDDNQSSSTSSNERKTTKLYSETDYFSEVLSNPTPPLSRSGYYSSRSRSNTPYRLNGSIKSPCKATTRIGTPCKLSSMDGRDYCYRHQTGSSVMGS